GPADGAVIRGVHLAEELYGVEVQSVSPADVVERFPGFHIPDGFEVTHEPEAGFLYVEKCVQTYLECAQTQGAYVCLNEQIQEVKVSDRSIEVTTDQQSITADSLIVTTGAWSSGCLSELQLPLEVVRKVLLWNPVREPVYNLDAGRGSFFFDMPEGEFYGFPSLDGATLKLAEHTGGETVDDPTLVDRSLHESDVPRVSRFVEAVMPALEPRPIRHAVCMYTRTPDGHFIVDRHPVNQRVVYGAGFSGHGFKFASVMGEILADLATTGATALPIEFLSAQRFHG
ncbi:MAG: N-methyl-L-tryptophan oxidase, partial [Planctomycetaceae bacterium]|nr:N-methyl-L-tryptophan oxidase [Planctomycetaceae bacterium]